MRWPWRAKQVSGPASLHRSFVTPEGVDLRLELGSAASRASAFLIDGAIIMVTMIAVTVAVALLQFSGNTPEIIAIIWLLGLFVLRNGWFVLFEMGSRGATPGKRLLGLRVIARDGARLTGAAVITRNAMREIEVFLPLSFLGYQGAEGLADGFLTLFALLWTGIFMLFPLFNRDKLRIGDLLAGTWVVRNVRNKLGDDLSGQAALRPTRVFTEAALDLYGIYELQTLEEVLRKRRDDAIATVAATIRRKAGIADDGDDYGFLTDYYTALCARLERGMMLGRKRADKHSRASGR
jgi:uncharacterized RDD family membrane protein YckC